MVTKEEIKGLRAELEDFSQEEKSLIPILQYVQNSHGYLPRNYMEEIGDYIGIPEGKVYSVATFYAQFRFKPLGEYLIKICHGTACHVNGADTVTETVESELSVNMGETTEDGEFTVERVACLGCCSLAPAMMVDETVYGNLTRDKIKDVLDDIRSEG